MHIQIFGNINGGYKPIQQTLFEQAGKQEQQLIFMKDIDLRKGMPEIKVDISKEGLRALHGSRLKVQVNFEEQEKERKFLSEHQPVDSFSNGFRKALENLKQKDENEATIEEKGQAVTDAFKSMVDEIVAGYADDKRLRFVEDTTSEDGYRKLSMDEELKLLKDEFAEFVNFRFGKERQEQNEKVAEAVNSMNEIKHKYGLGEVAQYHPEKIPDGFAEKLIHISREYMENIMGH